MARAHPEQHVAIQVVLHRAHPLFRFLEQERQQLGQSRAGYLRWLLEQQLLRARGVTMADVPTVTGVLSATATREEPSPLEVDDDLLASFLT